MKYVKNMELFQILLKKDQPQRGRLLGMDVGERYVGLAISDVPNKIASPHSVLIRKRSNVESIVEDLQDLVDRFSLVGFVIGYPLPIYRNQFAQEFQVKQFVDQLKKTSRFEDLVYTYWDERFTTKAVESMLKPLDLHPLQMKQILDKFAAVGILQGYLDNFQHETKHCTKPDT